ncbi:hypothetical protein [Streptomyces sp. NPDC026092]|uniref:hypothetical protein n=1 Tax=Streptomyces sp. NPDC026092 TaxID=3154797 RepID=UPI0033E53CD1
MNIVSELLASPEFVNRLRVDRNAANLKECLTLLGISNSERMEFTPEGITSEFEPIPLPQALEAQLIIMSVNAFSEAERRELPTDTHHGDPLWLQAKPIDPDAKEFATYPDEYDRTPRLMLYRYGEQTPTGVALDVISAEIEETRKGGKPLRRLRGLFRRHQKCPAGLTDHRDEFICPQGRCPLGGVCKPVTVLDDSGGLRQVCECQH